MKNLKLYIIEMFLFISVIIFNIVYRSDILQAVSIILATIFSCLLYGIYKKNTLVKNSVIRIVIASFLSFLIITYSLGLFVGFSRTVVSFSSNYILRFIVLQLVVIFCEEILRYIIIKKSIKSYLPVIFFTIIMVILNVITEINGYNLTDGESIFIFISVVVIPVISREVLCSYLSYKVSYVPGLLFKSLLTIYELVLPIIPNLGDYIYSVTNVLLVYIIYYFSSKSIAYAEKSDRYSRKVSNKIIYIPIIVVLVIIVILVSGVFRYKMIAIGSSSMSPVYERGDAVIYEKIDPESLNMGDIVAFKKNNIVVTHRIIQVKTSNGLSFKTKGDSNNAVDAFDVDSKEVLGKVEYKIKYIGYPTLWINQFFKRGEINYD